MMFYFISSENPMSHMFCTKSLPFFIKMLIRVATCQGKTKFLQVREKSGNFEKMSGNFGHLTNVRKLLGNFVMSLS